MDIPQVIWTDNAVTGLRRIFDYIAEDSPTYAESFLEGLIDATEARLVAMPNSGRVIPELQDTHLGFVRELIYKGYRVIYNPSGFPEKIAVLAVLHSRMDFLRQFKSEWILE